MKVFLLVLFALIGCNRSNQPTPAGPPPQQQQQQAPAPAVGVVEVQKTEVALSSELFGRVLSTSVAEIRPQVSGIILERSFKEGSFVEQGTQLYQINPALFEAALESAKGALAEAQARLVTTEKLAQRYRLLVKTKAVSQQEYDNAVAAHQEALAKVGVAEAQVKQAEINLRYTKVYSPISGYIGKSLVTQGALVTANQAEPLSVVRALDPVYVDLTFPASEALALRKRLGKYQINDELTVTLVLDEINEEYEHKGKVESRELAVDETTGAIGIRALVPNPDLLLLPGMFVRAYVDQLGHGSRVVVPQMAVQRDKNGDANVWIVKEDQSVERRRIETGVMYQQNWTVEAGLNPGEAVVVDNHEALQAGMKVKPISVGRQAQEKKED